LRIRSLHEAAAAAVRSQRRFVPTARNAMNAATTSTKTAVKCWSCGAAASGAHFCAACGKIQPLAQGMDYFEFFGLPEKLRIETAELEKRFHQLSWKLHPDNFVRATEKEREISLALSSELNDAYRALREPLGRVEYLLAHSGMRKEGAHKQQAPPELLEEVFELNESLDELRESREADEHGAFTGMAEVRAKLEAAEKNFAEKLDESDAQLDVIAGEWDAAIDAGADDEKRQSLMAKMNDVLNRRSYIRNLVNKVAAELAI
jgi:molecular chaperone HscB